MNESDTHDGRNANEEGRDAVETGVGKRGKWVSVLVMVLGLWLLLEAYLLTPVAGNRWSDAIVGVALIAVGGYNYYRGSNESFGSVGSGVVVALLGLWLVATPFVVGTAEGAAVSGSGLVLWNDVLVGLLVVAVGSYSAYRARAATTATPSART